MKSPLELSALILGLFQSESYHQIFNLSSKFVQNRRFAVKDWMRIFQWDFNPILSKFIFNLQVKNHQMPLYRVFDEETICCVCPYVVGENIVSVKLLYENGGRWSFYDIKLYLLQDFNDEMVEWSDSIENSKRSFALLSKVETGDSYWDQYFVQESTLKRSLESSDTDDYWDRY